MIVRLVAGTAVKIVFRSTIRFGRGGFFRRDSPTLVKENTQTIGGSVGRSSPIVLGLFGWLITSPLLRRSGCARRGPALPSGDSAYALHLGLPVTSGARRRRLLRRAEKVHRDSFLSGHSRTPIASPLAASSTGGTLGVESLPSCWTGGLSAKPCSLLVAPAMLNIPSLIRGIVPTGEDHNHSSLLRSAK